MTKKYDLMLKGGNVFLGRNQMDIAVKNGVIFAVEPEMNPMEAEVVYDITEKLVSPPFVDSHMHIDLAMTGDQTDIRKSILYAASAMRDYANYHPESNTVEDIVRRSSIVMEMCISHGTGAVKTNVHISKERGMNSLIAMNICKEKYKGKLDIIVNCPFIEGFEDEIEAAALRGEIDSVAGYSHFLPKHQMKEEVDRTFQFALKHNLVLDLHVDECDAAMELDCFNYILDKTRATGQQGNVTCGHVTMLSANGISEPHAQAAMAKCQLAGVSVTSLTSCNLFLMDMARRGPTRVEQLLDYGVNVSVASDNIRDPFRPLGNCNLIEEALLTAQVHKFGTTRKLSRCYEMITYNPAKNSHLTGYGIAPGCKADFVVMDAPDAAEAVLSRAKCIMSFKNGTLITKNGKILSEEEKS